MIVQILNRIFNLLILGNDTMNTQSTLKLFKSGNYNYIYVYFKYRGKLIRVNTEQEYIEGLHRKDLLYSAKMPKYELLNEKILNLKNKVDQYITRKLSYVDQKSIGVSQAECLNYIKTGEFTLDNAESKPLPKKLTFFDYYSEFYEFKNTALQNKPSLKDYKSLENALNDYQDYAKVKLTFDIINDVDFFNRFRNYLYRKHDESAKTGGELNANTVHKRFSSLKTFLRYVQGKNYYRFKDELYEYKTKKFRTDFVILSRAEIKQLEELKITNPNWQRIVDCFVCNCFLSLRYSDLSTMHKGEFKQDSDGDWYYTKKNEKTNINIEIPITETAYRILTKYDFKLPVLTNQYFNSEIKTILINYDLFKETVKKTVMRNGSPETKEYLKRDLISTHTCRRTFITLAIENNVPMNAIQACTGHTDLRILSIYVKRNRNKEQVNKID